MGKEKMNVYILYNLLFLFGSSVVRTGKPHKHWLRGATTARGYSSGTVFSVILLFFSLCIYGEPEEFAYQMPHLRPDRYMKGVSDKPK